MTSSIFAQNAGQGASILNALALGIIAADGDPDVELLRIFNQQGLGQQIGKLIMNNLFSVIMETSYDIDFNSDLATHLGRLRWSEEMKAAFPNEDKKEELYRMLQQSDVQSQRGSFTAPQTRPYRTVALSRRMTPLEIMKFVDPTAIPSLREVLQVDEFHRYYGSTSKRKNIALDARYFDHFLYFDESMMVAFHSEKEELPVGTKIILQVPSK